MGSCGAVDSAVLTEREIVCSIPDNLQRLFTLAYVRRRSLPVWPLK